jgi:hypothetical protein
MLLDYKTANLFRPFWSVNSPDVLLEVGHGGHGAGDEGLLQRSRRTKKTLKLQRSLLVQT